MAREEVHRGLAALFENGERSRGGDELAEVKQWFSFGLLHGNLLRLNLDFCLASTAERCMKKQMPFVAEGGDCPSAPSRAPVCGVHWSEAKTLDGRSGRIRRRVDPGRVGDNSS